MSIRYDLLIGGTARLSVLLVAPLFVVGGYLLVGEYSGLSLGLVDWRSDYAEAWLWAAALGLTFWAWPASPEERTALFVLWLLRMSVALGAMLAYEAFYPLLDSRMYYHSGARLADPLGAVKYGHGTEIVIALCGLLRELTDSFHAAKVVFAYVGQLGVYLFYRAACTVIARRQVTLLYVLGVFPSILFWSTILGKEPIVLAGLGAFCWGAVRWLVDRDLRALPWILAGLFVAAGIRTWLGVIFLTPFLSVIVLTGRQGVHVKLAFLALCLPAFLFAVQSVSQVFAISSAAELVKTTEQVSQSWAEGGSAQAIRGGFSSIADMLAFMPKGSFAALFRPLPGEVTNPFGILAGIENAILLGLVLWALLKNGVGWVREPVLMWAVATLVCWASVYGFASYQNLGTAFRFRLQVTPILLMLGLFLVFWPRLLPDRPAEPPRAA